MNQNRNSGFVKEILVLIVAFIIFSFFVDLKSSVNKNCIKNISGNYQYLKEMTLALIGKLNFISKKQIEINKVGGLNTTSSSSSKSKI